MFSIKINIVIKQLMVCIAVVYIQGCAVLTPSQVGAVSDFATAAKDYSELPVTVMDIHTQSMFAENIYASASLSDADLAAKKINKDVDIYIKSLDTFAQAEVALGVIDSYVQLLKKLTSADFTKKLEQECAVLGTEIDGGVSQYNEITGATMDGFGVIVAQGVRASGGIIIRYKQAKALKRAVQSAQPIIKTISQSVTELMDLYICGAVDDQGDCILGDDDQPYPGFGQLVEQGLVTEYQSYLKSAKGNNSVKEIQIFSKLLLKAKSIKPLAQKTRLVIQTFQAAHTKLYEKTLERQDLDGTIEEIMVLYGEIRSAQRFGNAIGN